MTATDSIFINNLTMYITSLSIYENSSKSVKKH